MSIPGKTQIQTYKEVIISGTSDFLRLLPIAAFLFIYCLPVQSLAFTESLRLASEPLAFERDFDLAQNAIVGIEAFPGPRSRFAYSSRIPDAITNPRPGVKTRVLVTAYSSTVNQTDANPFCTASGAQVHAGTLAANFLPFGTVVRIDGKEYRVEDRLSSRYNGKSIVDIWQPSVEAGLNFGVQAMDLEVVSVP